MSRRSKKTVDSTSHQALEELYQALFEQAADGVFIANPQGRYLAVNRRGCEILGYSRDELLNLSLVEVFPAEDSAHPPLPLTELLTGKTVVSEWLMRGKDGRLIPVEISGQVLSNGNILGIVRDITARKRAEELLRQSEAQYRKLYESLMDGFTSVSMDGKIIDFNPSYQTMLGYDAAEIRTLTYTDITPEKWHRFEQQIITEQVLPKGYSDVYEKEYRRKDGTIFPVELQTYLFKDAQGTPLGMWAIVRDITERKLAQLALEQERTQLKTLIRTIPDLVWLKNSAGVYLTCNSAFERFFGVPEAEIIGKTDYDFVETELADFFRARDQVAIAAGRPSINDEWVTFADNGRHVLLETIKTPLRDSTGQLIGVLGIARDVTATRQAEIVLRERLELQDRLEKITATAPGGLCSFLLRPDGTTCLPYVSPAWEEIHGLKAAEVQHSANPVFQLFHPDDMAYINQTIAESARTMTPWQAEYRMITPHRGEVWVEGHSTPVQEPDGGILWHGFITDITTRKRSEEAKLVQQRVIESMDQVNRAIQKTDDLEQMMNDVLTVVLSIFDCDRAWLFYPCDPEAPSFRVPMEITRPEYPGANLKNIAVPMSPDLAQNLRDALESDEPVTYTAGTDSPINKVTAEQFGVQSQILISVYPKLGKPWVFGLHQCSFPRLWTATEKRLFQEIGRRLTDALSSLLAHRHLQESENRYRRITEGLTDYQYSVRVENGQPVEATHSLTCAIVTGYTAEEFAADPSIWFEMIAPEDRELVQKHIQQILAGNEIPPLEYRIRRKDGETRWVSDTAILFKDTSGKLLSYDGVIKDITERKQAEEALRLQSAALNAAANAILITDRTGLIQWANPAFGELTGYTTAETIGKNLRDLVKSGQQERSFYQNLWHTILEGQVWRGEIINRRKDGSLYIEEQTITPVRNPQGQISHFIAIKQDISPRKALETENQKLTEQFYQAQKMDSIGQLAGGIAHDFNNLLVPIIGYAELGMMEAVPDSNFYTHFEQVKSAGDRAADLTRQILAFSRRQLLEMKTIDLNQVIIEFEKMLQRLIGENINLKTSLAANLPVIKADKGQLEQVLLNLAVNARDAMPHGGRLSIETVEVLLDEAYAASHAEVQPGPYVLLAMSDTGHGMDAATQQRIFEPFFTTKPRGYGTGLGLSTVFGIVKQHGGNIWVYSEPGQGTTIKIYLPAADRLASVAPPEPSVTKLLRGIETIMVIEDETTVRQLVCHTLRGHGYRVLEIDDPTQGLAMAATYPGIIHLLLTDVIMPAMNGRELFQHLASDRPGVKVLYMSGYTDDTIAHHGVLDEGVAFLQKPFTIRKLLEKVRTVLG